MRCYLSRRHMIRLAHRQALTEFPKGTKSAYLGAHATNIGQGRDASTPSIAPSLLGSS